MSTPDIELASMQPYVKDGKLTRYCEECQRSRKGSKYRSYVCLSQKDEDAHRIIFHPNKKKRKPSLSASATEKTEKGKKAPKIESSLPASKKKNEKAKEQQNAQPNVTNKHQNALKKKVCKKAQKTKTTTTIN